MQKYKFLEHTADIKFQAFGKSLKEVFENSVLAVSEVLRKEKKIKSVKKKLLVVKGKDNENLLQNLLEEIIYLLDAKNFVVSKAKINFDKNIRNIRVEFFGDDVKNYKDLQHIKAVTYSEMFVKNQGNKWITQVVLDI